MSKTAGSAGTALEAIETGPEDSIVSALLLEVELLTVSACAELDTVAGDGVEAAAMLLSTVGGVDDVIDVQRVELDELYG